MLDRIIDIIASEDAAALLVITSYHGCRYYWRNRPKPPQFLPPDDR